MAEEEVKQQHFAWLIESRNRNQICALHLRNVLRKHERRWKTKEWSAAAQELTSVSFSLWRAAFLAEKTGKRSEVFKHGTEFLERVIEDNAISYAQDKNMREWTFNYYTRNARFSLEYLHKRWPDIVTSYEVKARQPKSRWEYCQYMLEIAVANFERMMEGKAAEKEASTARSARRRIKKANRALVREMQLSERNPV